jgi:hypothetical protein
VLPSVLFRLYCCSLVQYCCSNSTIGPSDAQRSCKRNIKVRIESSYGVCHRYWMGNAAERYCRVGGGRVVSRSPTAHHYAIAFTQNTK